MKTELLEKLEMLLEAKNPLEVSKEFNQASAQLKSLIEAFEANYSMDNKADSGVEETASAPMNEAEVREAAIPVSKEEGIAHSAKEVLGEENLQADSEDATSAHTSQLDGETESAPAIEGEQNIPEVLETIEATSAPSADDANLLEVKQNPEKEAATATDESAGASAAEAIPEEAPVRAHAEKDSDPEVEESSTATESSEKTSDQEDAKASASMEGDKDEPTDNTSASDDIARIKEKYKEINAAFKAKVSSARQELKRIEEETVATAKHLLEELETIVANEENIGKAFAGFNAVQEKWKSLPKVSNDNYRDLNAEYNKLAERFFYNINIYKELKELDLKKNLEQKLKVLEDQRKLTNEADIRLLEVEVRMNQDRWNEIGPTFKEEWDKIKDEFWAITRSIYKRIQDFYNQRKEEQDKNLEAKKEILEKAKYFQHLDLKNPKKWTEKTKEIIELQKEWKLIGFVPKEQLKPVWKEFRAICDAFFEQKKLHFQAIKAEQDANKKSKETLIAIVEEWKTSTDWKTATNQIIAAQKQWKEIGAAGPKEENWLWRKFRAACDQFFQARTADKAEEIEQQANNLKQKSALLEALSAFEPNTAKVSESIAQLKEFADQYRSIGHVPFKEKDSINKTYRKLMDEKYGLLKIEKSEKEKLRFEEKISNLKSADSKDRLVQKEMDHIRSKISKIESEINQYENNLGFFANSKGADKLKAEVLKKIEKAKEEVDGLYSQLDMLNEV